MMGNDINVEVTITLVMKAAHIELQDWKSCSRKSKLLALLHSTSIMTLKSGNIVVVLHISVLQEPSVNCNNNSMRNVVYI